MVPVTVSGQTTQFIYDGDGNMVKKVKPDGSKTLYIGGIYEVDKTSGGTVTRTVTYYPAGGAMRINSTLYYILKDHLGSASVVTDSTGVTVGEDRFYPYGETRFTSGTIFTDKLFTGQRDVGLGIYHYGARFYSQKLGRFLSPDTIVPGAANPQAYNRYSYVLNNPIRYNDPTGHMCSDPDDPTPSCDGGGSYPTNTNPLPDSPVVINNPGPLDDGQEQDDPTPTLDVIIPVCDAICQAVNWWYQNISSYQYTPIAMSSIQFITGTWMTWLEPAIAFPPTTEVAVPLYILSFAENRAASLIGWQAVDYQYDHGLYGVSKTDDFIAGGTLLAGVIIPPLAPLVSDVSFAWDIFHTDWKDFP